MITCLDHLLGMRTVWMMFTGLGWNNPIVDDVLINDGVLESGIGSLIDDFYPQLSNTIDSCNF